MRARYAENQADAQETGRMVSESSLGNEWGGLCELLELQITCIRGRTNGEWILKKRECRGRGQRMRFEARLSGFAGCGFRGQDLGYGGQSFWWPRVVYSSAIWT